MPGRSPFAMMCDELTRTATRELVKRGFTPPSEAFSRHSLKYEFTRQISTGVQVLEILFNKYRRPLFSVQVYVAPSSGVPALVERGGPLVIGSLSPSPRRWPFPLRPFRAEPGRVQRLLGIRGDDAPQAVQSFVSLLDEVEEWWGHQGSTKHIIVGTLTYSGTRTDHAGADRG